MKWISVIPQAGLAILIAATLALGAMSVIPSER